MAQATTYVDVSAFRKDHCIRAQFYDSDTAMAKLSVKAKDLFAQ